MQFSVVITLCACASQGAWLVPMAMALAEVLVVDSGAFIKATSLEEWSPNIITVKEVLAELKDENTRRKLSLLPYSLDFREPTHVALQHGKNE